MLLWELSRMLRVGRRQRVQCMLRLIPLETVDRVKPNRR